VNGEWIRESMHKRGKVSSELLLVGCGPASNASGRQVGSIIVDLSILEMGNSANRPYNKSSRDKYSLVSN
jgi:hypothetical protein